MDRQPQQGQAQPAQPPPAAAQRRRNGGIDCGSVVLFFMAAGAACMFSSMHIINEGHVGVYYRGGALLDSVTHPGFNFKLPFVTRVEQVQVTLQTDEVTKIPCGTSGGVVIYFDRVEVVNILDANSVHDTVRKFTTRYDEPLIFAKIHHELNQYCSKHTLHEVYVEEFENIDEYLSTALQNDLTKLAPGLTVMAVRVTKPNIPDKIRDGYEAMEAEKTNYLVSVQRQKVVEKDTETERKREIILAEKEAEVAKIRNEQALALKKTDLEIAALADRMHLAREKALVDAQFYAATMAAKAEKERLTPQYLEMLRYTSIANNTKIFFGPDIPKLYASNAVGPLAE